MKTKSVNHLTISVRLTTDAATVNDGNVVKFKGVHNVGPKALFLNCVIFMNLGKKSEKKIDTAKLTKGNELVLDGSLKPTSWIDKEGRQRNGTDFVVSRISEPEIVEDGTPNQEVDGQDEVEEA